MIQNDLMLLTKVLQDIACQQDLSASVSLALDACKAKVKVSRRVAMSQARQVAADY